MSLRRAQFLPLTLCASLLGCSDPVERPTPREETALDSAAIVAAVEAAVWAFHAADTTRNPQGVIDLLWPEFYMFVDGARTDYEAVSAGSREFLPSLQTFATEWSDLRITPLGPDHAVSSFVFLDSIVTRTGDLIRSQGPTTFVWERRHGEWRILYADADHYPIE
jgi:hypothetical protein